MARYQAAIIDLDKYTEEEFRDFMKNKCVSIWDFEGKNIEALSEVIDNEQTRQHEENLGETPEREEE